MSGGYRTQLIKILTFLGGIYFFLQFVFPEKLLDKIGISQYHEVISYGFIAVGSVAFGLGLINLFLIHGSKIIFLRSKWIYSAALLGGLLLMMTVSTQDWLSSLKISGESREYTMLAEFAKRIKADSESDRKDVPEAGIRTGFLREAVGKALGKFQTLNPTDPTIIKDYSDLLPLIIQQVTLLNTNPRDLSIHQKLSGLLQQAGAIVGRNRKFQYEQSVQKKLFDLLNLGLFVSLGSAMFSLLGVYIAAAAYRAFRIKSLESSFMMIAAVIVMLGQIPFGVWLYEGLPEWRLWLLEVPNSAAFRAIRIGASLAGLILAFRMWFSIESGSFVKDEERSE